MIELLILHELYNKVLTMYGISKAIHEEFSVVTKPSIGTIKPALVRLEKGNYIKSQKVMSEGGRPSIYYSITNDGQIKLIKLLLDAPVDNTINFLTLSRLKIACSNVLNKDDQYELLKKLKLKAEKIYIEAQNKQALKDLNFQTKLIYENIVCEYKNFISLLEGMERAGKN